MEGKQNPAPLPRSTAPVSNSSLGGNQFQNSIVSALNTTGSGNVKSGNSVTSKGGNKTAPISVASNRVGSGSESMGGAIRAGAATATGPGAVNKTKSTSGSSTTTAINSAATKQQKQPSASVGKLLNTVPSAQKGGALHSETKPNLRQFNVTHLSDNWKRRKAEKAAALERERLAKLEEETALLEAAKAEAAESTDKFDNEMTIPIESEKSMTPDSLEEDEDKEPEAKEASPFPKNILLALNELKGDTASKLEQLEFLLQGNKLEDLPEALTSGKENVTAVHRKYEDLKKKTIVDFDIDKSPSESESEDPPQPPRRKDKTLMAYMTACAKSGLKPNQTFMRQCGRPSIDMRNRMLTHEDAKPMAIALVGDRRTSLLDLSDNPLGPQGATCIAEMMYANKSIMELNLSNTDVGTEGLKALTQTLPNNRHLRRLHLDSNKLQEGDGRHLAKLVTTVPDLRELHLNHTTLGFKDGTRLALALASDTGNLNTLSLQYNNIRTESAVQLALSLGKNTTLKHLNLAWNGFGADGCRALAKALEENNTLTELDLTNNRLGITSLEHIVEGLKKNTSLKSVKFGTNPMTTEGAKALITALTQNQESTVEEIDLRGIPIDQEFMDMVVNLKDTRGITVLHDPTIQMGTSDQTKKFDGDNLDRFDPVMVLFEYMKKDNLRVIDLFQFMDQKKRDKLSRKDLRDGVNTLRLPFTEDALDQIMKALDKNKDGFIQLEEMMKGYKENESVVKQRRIKANWKRKPDRGLEDLWEILKELIAKRKADNEKRSQEAQAQTQAQTPRKGRASISQRGSISKRGSIAQ